MNIILDITFHSRETNFMQSGSFPVSVSEFKKDPDWTASIASYEWIQQIKRNHSYSGDFRINKVVYNGEHDITELVKKVKPIIQDDLPF